MNHDIQSLLESLKELTSEYESVSRGSRRSSLDHVDWSFHRLIAEMREHQQLMDDLLAKAFTATSGRSDAEIARDFETNRHELIARETRLGRRRELKRKEAEQDIKTVIDRARVGKLNRPEMNSTDKLVEELTRSHTAFMSTIRELRGRRWPWKAKRSEKSELRKKTMGRLNGTGFIIQDAAEPRGFEYSFISGTQSMGSH